MSKITFKEGDVVTRKTDSRLMTVEMIRNDDLISTVWFDSDGHVQRDCFHPDTLFKWQIVFEGQ